MAEVLTIDGRRNPPDWFVSMLKRFDPCLRVQWGMGQAVPFAGWIIERKIPEHMRARSLENVSRQKKTDRPSHWINERYADQVILDAHGNPASRRLYDMLPEWHEVYRCMDAEGNPVLELGEFVIDYLRRNYERTLLGRPDLSMAFHKEQQDKRVADEAQQRTDRIDAAAEAVMDHKFEIFSDVMAFGGQPSTVFKENADEHSAE